MKQFIPIIFSVFLGVQVFAQTNISIENQSTLNLTDCDPTVISASAYDGANFHAIEIYYPQVTAITAVVNPGYFGHVWDVDGSSEVRIFNGLGTTAELLGTYNTADFPNGFLLNAEVNALRIEFEPGVGGSGNGFDMSLFCSESTQALPVAIFQPVLTEDWYYDTELDMHVFRACRNETFNIAIEPVFLDPQTENQDVNSMLIKWVLGNHNFIRGQGITEIDHVYTEGNGYLATVYSQDATGAESYLKFMVRNSPRPEFTLDENPVFCENETTEIAGGMNGDEVVGALAQAGSTSVTEFYGTELFLPDGNNNNYTTTIVVDGFPEGTTISNASDLAALCVNMEHSYLGDLEMMLTCPDGTGINIFNAYYGGTGLFGPGFGGGGTFLGDANDDGTADPGIGFDYCYSTDATWGTLGEEHEMGNTIPVSTFQPGTAMTPGVYQPEESFESFVGCPVNGEWILTVRDNWFIDNGYIFDWSLAFSEDVGAGLYEYELISAGWADNDMITATNEGSIEITPTNGEPTDLVFSVTDENGCSFSNVVTVQVSDTLTAIDEPVICELTHEVPWPNASGELVFVSGPSSDVTVSNSGEIFEVEVAETGDYTFEFNYFECSDTPQAHLIFLDPNDPACIETGLSYVELTDPVVLAPNPTTDQVNISFGLRKSQQVHITLTTAEGKVVSNESHSLSSGSQNLNINLEKFDAGFYLLSLKGESFQATQVVIKQ